MHDDLATAADAGVLLDVVRALSVAREVDAVTGVVKRAARKLTGADGVTFVLRDQDQCYYIDEDAISPLWKGRRFPLTACISGWAMLHGDVVVIEDIYVDDRIPHDAYRPTFVKSLAMVPVRPEDPIAAIGAYWARRHRASEREVGLLQLLADTTAVVLENIRLIGALEDRARESDARRKQLEAEVALRLRVEEQLVHAQKMEAVARLAGGVAHDFNNHLMVIGGYGSILLGDDGLPAEAQECIEQIVATAERAGALVRQLLAFSRRQVLQPVVLDPNEVVREMDRMLQRLLGADIDLLTKLSPDIGHIEFDPGQLEQVVMNLAVNARDAMPEGGKLTIETADVDLSEDYVAAHPKARSGPHVLIAVSDTGHGMSPEVKARIFEPFFTTKERGRGTGLGLATVHGIVRQGGGTIWVYSEIGQGTTFKVYIPCTETRADRSGARRTEPLDVRGTETLLVVEDEEAVRRLLARVLTGAGYTVLEAGDHDEAQRVCSEHDGTIHLLLTDVVLPGLGGRKLAENLLEQRPEMRVAYMSGYTDDAIVHHGVLDPGIAFVEKPIAPSLLLEKIRTFLS